MARGWATPVQPVTAGRRTSAPTPRQVGRRPPVDNSITITEAARRLGVSTKTVRRRIADGSLAAHRAAGPGGFQYRVTDPSVLVVQPGLEPRLDNRARENKPTGQELAKVLLELSNRVADEREARVRVEWERDALRAEVEALRRVLPAPVATPATARRWWWPF